MDKEFIYKCECGGELTPSCLGCGGRYFCDKCNYEEKCGCTDYE